MDPHSLRPGTWWTAAWPQMLCFLHFFCHLNCNIEEVCSANVWTRRRSQRWLSCVRGLEPWIRTLAPGRGRGGPQRGSAARLAPSQARRKPPQLSSAGDSRESSPGNKKKIKEGIRDRKRDQDVYRLGTRVPMVLLRGADTLSGSSTAAVLLSALCVASSWTKSVQM